MLDKFEISKFVMFAKDGQASGGEILVGLAFVTVIFVIVLILGLIPV